MNSYTWVQNVIVTSLYMQLNLHPVKDILIFTIFSFFFQICYWTKALLYQNVLKMSVEC